MSAPRHLYAHLPFCAAPGRGHCALPLAHGADSRLDRRDAYLDARLPRAELRREGEGLDALETVYLGGGTPTLMRPRRLRARCSTTSARGWPRAPR